MLWNKHRSTTPAAWVPFVCYWRQRCWPSRGSLFSMPSRRWMSLIWEGLPSFPHWRLLLSAFGEVYYALRPVNTVLSLKRPSAARWMHALFNKDAFSFQGQWTISKSTEAFWNNQQIPLGLHYFLRSRVMFKMRKASSNHFDVFVGQGTSCLMHAISVWSVCRRKSTHAAVYN